MAEDRMSVEDNDVLARSFDSSSSDAWSSDTWGSVDAYDVDTEDENPNLWDSEVEHLSV